MMLLMLKKFTYVKESFYRIHFWYISKGDATGIMSNSI